MVGGRGEAVDRRERHDRAAGALLAHPLAGGLQHPEHLREIVLQRPVPVLLGRVEDAVPARSADDVDADVDPAQALHRLVQGAVHLGPVGHVGDDRERRTSSGNHLRGDALRAIGVEIDAGYRRTGLGQP
ncbi:MAG TPA: hypothetical protein VK402_13020 [Blastococcus sp.]|nr:hypothetical protein [Blastococcus sp.]